MKRYIVIVALAALLVLSGCTTTEGNDHMSPFLGGSDGVSVEFEMEAPPPEVIAGDEFPVIIRLMNVGEHTVPASDYYVRLKGFSPTEFSTTSSALEIAGAEELQANEMNPDTGEVLEAYPVLVDVPANSGYLNYQGAIAGNMPFPFVAEVCYRYVTTANAKLCIKKDLRKTTDTDVCTISGAQTISSSGAPVRIENFNEFAGGGDAVRFSFKVVAADAGGDISLNNVGDGVTCDESRNLLDRMYVTVNSGMSGLSCSGFLSGSTSSGDSVEGYVRLTGGSRQITCTQPVSDDLKGDYVKIVSITAEYDYLQSHQEQVLVKQLI